MGAEIITVASGKGGVGKTFVTSSLGITLTKFNKSILLVDFDLSGANLHSVLGLPLSDRTLRNFFDGSHKIIDLILPTKVPRLSYVQGYWDEWSPTSVTLDQVKRFIEACRHTEFDYVIVDLGAGVSTTHLELIRHGDEKIFVIDPEPTTVEKFYRMLEAYICYTLREHSNAEAFLKIQTALKEYRHQNKLEMFSFRDYLKNATGFSFDHFAQATENPLRLIVNSCRSRQDLDLGHSIKSICSRYFDINFDYIGGLDFDNAVWQSSRKCEPTLVEKPFTPLAGQFLTIAKTIISHSISSKKSANQIKDVV